MRRFLILGLLPLALCAVPVLAACLIAAVLPPTARTFYLEHVSPFDIVILALGCALFIAQMFMLFHGLRLRAGSFDERTDRWISNLAQAAEWFPLLGLLGTVAGILQTFSSIHGPTPQDQIIRMYAPAMTATGSGLFMALVNILPTWVMLVGRDLIQALAGAPAEKK